MESSDSYAITARRLNMSFDNVQVLKDVEFNLIEGEIHAVVGANGAGKSTLMKILNGVYRQDSGEIKIFDQTVGFNSPEDARKSGIAMVFQELSLIPTLSVSENIFLQSQPYRIGPLINDSKADDKTRSLLKMVGVESDTSPQNKVQHLTGGQKQIIEILKALSHEPRILILDEPTASLTHSEINNLFSVISTLKEQGISIIYITHYLEDVFKICDKVTVMRDGANVLTSLTSELSVTDIVDAMVGSKTEKVKTTQRQDLRNGTPLLDIQGITNEHIQNVSIQAYKGEIVGIAGLLGSGRSEFMNAVFGIDRIKSGKIFIEGVEIKINSPTDALKSGIALVPENRREQGLILEFSVMDNVVMPILTYLKKFLMFNEKKARSLTEEYIRSLDIKTQGWNQVTRKLSGGNQQKIVVSKCLLSNSRIMLLDDPTFGVDIRAKQDILKIIREYTDKGNTVIFVSSEFNEIASYCDSIYIMKRGQINGFTDTITTEDALLEMVQ